MPHIFLALEIFKYLDDPSDLIHASAVSHFWHGFVVANKLCKELCSRLFPQLRSVDCVTDREDLEREHKAYSFLAQALTKFTPSDCMAGAISASSTGHYPLESISNTLDPRDRVLGSALHWSSRGCSDPGVPETLLYKLIANLCVITEISIQPFQAYFQHGLPIYSAKFVRFRMGYPKPSVDLENDLRDLPLQFPADDMFIWTYASQKFPMAQENCLQKFKLPEPVLCVGGFLQIELLGRVQRQEMNGLFYIRISHVKVFGRPLPPAFDAKFLEPSGKFFAEVL